MSEQEREQPEIQAAVAYARRQIMDAAMTYQPTSRQFSDVVSSTLEWLADRVQTDTSIHYEQEMYKTAQQNTANVLSAVLAGVKIGEEETSTS